MSRTPKTTDRIMAECMLRDYEKNKRRMQEIKDDYLNGTRNRPEVLISGQGNTSDDTARRALYTEDKEYKVLCEYVNAVDFADMLCFKARNGRKIAKIIDLVYKKGTHTMYGAAVQVRLCRADWAGRLAARYFQWINDWFTI